MDPVSGLLFNLTQYGPIPKTNQVKQHGLTYDKEAKGWYSRTTPVRRTIRQELWLATNHPKFIDNSITNFKYLPENAAAKLYRDKVLNWLRTLPEKAATEIEKIHGIGGEHRHCQ